MEGKRNKRDLGCSFKQCQRPHLRGWHVNLGAWGRRSIQACWVCLKVASLELQLWPSRLRTWLVSMRMRIQSLALLSGLRMWRCGELQPRVQMWLRFLHCQGCGIGCSSSSGSAPSLGTSTCCKCSPKKSKEDSELGEWREKRVMVGDSSEGYWVGHCRSLWWLSSSGQEPTGSFQTGESPEVTYGTTSLNQFSHLEEDS